MQQRPLEHPSSGRPEKVSSLGLLCFLPDTYEAGEGKAGLFEEVQWIEVPRDDHSFVAFLGEVVSVLKRHDPPSPDQSCQWCEPRDGFRVAA
jgi:hypothetical protein